MVKILSSPDGRYIYSAGSDGVVFVYAVTEMVSENVPMKNEVSLEKQDEVQ